MDAQKLREALAPLPRIVWGRSKATVVIPETDDFAGKYLSIDGLDKQYARRLAAYIATANPANVSALLDRIDTQAAEIARLRGACEKAIEWLEGWASAEPYLSELRAALAQEQS